MMHLVKARAPRFLVPALVVGAVFSLGYPLAAQSAAVATTPGTIARFGVPPGYQHQYQPASDTLVLVEPGLRQIILFAWAPGDERVAIQGLLEALGAPQYGSQIRAATVAGAPGAEVRIDAGGGSKDWIAAVPREGMLIGIWGKTAGDFPDLGPPVNTVMRSLSLAPASLPSGVVGTYQTAGESSSSYDGGGVFFEEYVTLYRNGVAERSTNLAGQAGDVSLSGTNVDSPVRWEVRGNRLLFYGGGEYSNFEVRVFNNGLELIDSDGSELLWVRQ
jgi:hypothetical protein